MRDWRFNPGSKPKVFSRLSTWVSSSERHEERRWTMSLLDSRQMNEHFGQVGPSPVPPVMHQFGEHVTLSGDWLGHPNFLPRIQGPTALDCIRFVNTFLDCPVRESLGTA